MPRQQPHRQKRRQLLVDDILVGHLDRIVQPHILQQSALSVINDEAGLGIPVAGLTDAAHVDDITVMLQIQEKSVIDKFALIIRIDGGNVGMADKHQTVRNLVQILPRFVVVEDVMPFVGLLRGAVHEQDVAEFMGKGEVFQIGCVGRRQLVAAPQHRFPGIFVEIVHIGQPQHRMIVIAHQTLGAGFTDQFDAFIGAGAVTHDIAKTDNLFNLLGVDIGECGF